MGMELEGALEPRHSTPNRGDLDHGRQEPAEELTPNSRPHSDS